MPGFPHSPGMHQIRLACVVFCAGVIQISAATINIDYTYDIADGGNFFGTHPEARASLERAAADVGAVISSFLGPIPSDVFTGSQGASTASINWSLQFANPVTTAPVTIDTLSAPADSITLYVGMRPLTSGVLGVGGPAGGRVSLGAGGPTGGRAGAFEAAQDNSNAVMPRGAGPVIGTVSGTFVSVDYSLRFGSVAGRVSFSNDFNSDGTPDDFATLDDNWHFELSPPAAGQNDFYSVAVHEILHAIGFGTSESWNTLNSDGTNWLGSNAIALNGGSGENLVSGDHLLAGFMSTSIFDGSPQEAAMDPNIIVGTRKYITEMDLAILRDLGFQTVPEPAHVAFISGAALLAFGVLRRIRHRAC